MTVVTEEHSLANIVHPEDDINSEDSQIDIENDTPAYINADGTLNPDHPLLAQAQSTLAKQLREKKQRLVEELREKSKAIKDTSVQREDTGVNLYQLQSQLATLQLKYEETSDECQTLFRQRQDTEQQLRTQRESYKANQQLYEDLQKQVEQQQTEADKQALAIKEIEKYNEEMQSNIAVARRETYASEQAATKLEKEKVEQDYLINQMQEQIKSIYNQVQLYTAQVEAQKLETRSAKEALAQAEQQMEQVRFDKSQLNAQWKSSLIAIERRDRALLEIENGLSQQREQMLNIEQETAACEKQINQQMSNNEKDNSTKQLLEASHLNLQKQLEVAKEKSVRIQDILEKFQKSKTTTDEQIRTAEQEDRILNNQLHAVDQAYMKLLSDTRQLEEQLLNALSEQTAAERSSNKSAKDCKAVRKQIQEQDIQVTLIQNELAKLQVDLLNTGAHNHQLSETLSMIDQEIKDKLNIIQKQELDIQRRNNDINKKTREVDQLNRAYEKVVSNMGDENTGPLEATINNLQREITKKQQESKELQRRWINWQTELVSLQLDNGRLDEDLTRLKSEHTIMFNKRTRLLGQYDSLNKGVKQLEAQQQQLHNQLQRLNGLVAENTKLQAELAHKTQNLQHKTVEDLRDLEEQAIRMETQIEESKQDKRQVLEGIIDIEKQIVLCERKITLEQEMQEMLDPNIGQDIAGAMKKEIHRMDLRLADIKAMQQKLVKEMIRAVNKRESIDMKGKAATMKQSEKLTESQLQQALTDLERSIQDTFKESTQTKSRIKALEDLRQQLSNQTGEVGQQIFEVQKHAQTIRDQIKEKEQEKLGCIYTVSLQQKLAVQLQSSSPKVKLEENRQQQLQSKHEAIKNRINLLQVVVNEVKEQQDSHSDSLDKLIAQLQSILQIANNSN